MPSELQRVARGLVDCFDEIPRVVDQLLRTAARCRENAQVALIASRGQATVAAQQLDAAARACEAAAHFLSMAPPKARGWAEGLVGTAGPSTNRPSSDSADRNKSTSGTRERDVEVRTRRLTATYEDLEVVEDNEPPLVTVARKAFDKYRKAHEDDDRERDDKTLLELEITVTETGEVIFEEPDEKEDEKREDRLARDFELDADLTEAVKSLLESMAESEDENWQHATLTITTDQIEATFVYPENPRPEPLLVDLELPDHPAPNDLDWANGHLQEGAVMSTSDNVFAAAGDSVAEVAEWLVDALGLESVADADLKEDERLFRRATRRGSGTVAVRVRPNGFAVVDPEPDEIQAIDRYPIDLSVWLVGTKDDEWQLHETKAIFDDLVTARPDVPALLVHNLDTLVSAHLPGAGTHTFDPAITPDVEDIDTWRSWVRS